MQKIFTFFLLFIFSICSLTGFAEAYRSIIIQHPDLHYTSISMEADMNTSLIDGNMIFSSAKGQVSMPVSDVKHWTFSNEYSGSDVWNSLSVTNADICTRIRILNTSIILNNIPENAYITLSTLDGQSIFSTKASDSLVIPVDFVDNHIFILTINNKSFKIAL